MSKTQELARRMYDYLVKRDEWIPVYVLKEKALDYNYQPNVVNSALHVLKTKGEPGYEYVDIACKWDKTHGNQMKVIKMTTEKKELYRHQFKWFDSL